MESFSYKCPRCGNSDPASIGYINGVPYCRLCLPFKGESVVKSPRKISGYKPHLKYQISKEQEEISHQVLENYMNGVNTLIDAVCGAGKTEIILEVISYALYHNMTVGFAIPRRDVVIEIAQRLTDIFTENEVISVYGGHNDILIGDIIVLTTHQLFRYENYFDLLIMDEIDAFPYKNNKLLNFFFESSVSKNYVLMTATASDEMLESFNKPGYQVLSLNSRFHGHLLPVPQLKVRRKPFNYICLYRQMKRIIDSHKPLLVFCPTIYQCEFIYSLVKHFFSLGDYVHSKRENREKIIDDFKANRYHYLITTSVLERGVTVENLQVIIFNADNPIYSKETLIQISGRVGRKASAPEGEVIYIAEEKTNAIVTSIEGIEEKNAHV
ncbi:MAG: DEAD/DEAH box helicase family protein [Coprobacillus sp.]|nr:DEAD/DEAH box helicase family protein [Coprobacillus sp.]